MDRILLSLAVAAAAYFGPWMLDSTGDIIQAGFQSDAIAGSAFVERTVECVMNGEMDWRGDCAPEFGLLGQLVGGTIALAVISAVLSIVGLLPLVGRLTSLVTILAGVAAVATFAFFAKEILTTEGANFADFRWGAYATGAFGLLTIFSGLSGIRGGND